MAFDRLALYNAALLLCGERFLASLVEDREPRRLLDQVYNTNGVDYLLEQGQWFFAMRTVMIDYDPAIAPTFGYRKAFTKPSDWRQTCAVCSDEFFRTPLLGYADEPGGWYADITPIYVKYISNDLAFGGDLSKWPASFCDYAAAYFATRIISKLAGDKSAQETALYGPPGQPEKGILGRTKHAAKTQAAFGQPPQYVAQGNWTRARRGRRSGYNDRGNTGSLTG
jgi:hypothetical protein